MTQPTPAGDDREQWNECPNCEGNGGFWGTSNKEGDTPAGSALAAAKWYAVAETALEGDTPLLVVDDTDVLVVAYESMEEAEAAAVKVRTAIADTMDAYAGLRVMDAKRDLLLALAADFSREAAAVRVGASDPMARYASSFDRGNLIGRAELLEELAEEITKSGGLKFPFAEAGQ